MPEWNTGVASRPYLTSNLNFFNFREKIAALACYHWAEQFSHETSPLRSYISRRDRHIRKDDQVHDDRRDEQDQINERDENPVRVKIVEHTRLIQIPMDRFAPYDAASKYEGSCGSSSWEDWQKSHDESN